MTDQNDVAPRPWKKIIIGYDIFCDHDMADLRDNENAHLFYVPMEYADIIITAVNTHDRLVAALEVTLAILEDASMIDSDDYKKSLAVYNEAKGEK